jgi:adenylosuccinate synthase
MSASEGKADIRWPNARRYLDWIEEAIGVRISHISVGPRRDQIIYV